MDIVKVDKQRMCATTHVVDAQRQYAFFLAGTWVKVIWSDVQVV